MVSPIWQQHFPIPGEEGFNTKKIRFWGAPYHGLVENGILTLFVGTKFLPSASVNWDKFNGLGCQVFQRPGWTVPTRTDAQIAADGAAGYVWKDYALIIGRDRYLWGSNIKLGATGYLYADSNHDVWWIRAKDLEESFFPGIGPGAVTWPATITVTFTVTKFVISATDQRQLDAFTLEVPVEFPFDSEMNLDESGGAGFNWTLCIGTHDRSGTTVAFHLLPYAFGGIANQQTHYATWIVETAGIPTESFVITSTLHAWHNPLGIYPGINHTWVLPDGTVEDFTIEQNDSFDPPADPSSDTGMDTISTTYSLSGFSETTVQRARTTWEIRSVPPPSFWSDTEPVDVLFTESYDEWRGVSVTVPGETDFFADPPITGTGITPIYGFMNKVIPISCSAYLFIFKTMLVGIAGLVVDSDATHGTWVLVSTTEGHAPILAPASTYPVAERYRWAINPQEHLIDEYDPGDPAVSLVRYKVYI